MGLAALRLATMLLSLTFSVNAAAETPFERQVLVLLNEARAKPQRYAEELRQYRGYFHANLVRYPGMDAAIETQEGVKVVDETIGFLGHQSSLGSIEPSALLRATAHDLVADQSKSGATGHEGADGTSPGDRSQRRGGGPYVAEVITYGSIDPADVVRQLIVDDGVADRGHRGIIYSPELRFAGVSCGSHPEYRTMCVIDLGIFPDGSYPARGTRMAAR